MSLRQLVRGLIDDGFGPEQAVHYECRHCGVALESPEDECTECGSTDVSRYVIE